MLSNMTLNPYLVPSLGLIDYHEEYKDKFKYKLSLIILLFVRTILMHLLDNLKRIILIKRQGCKSGNNRLLTPNSVSLCRLGFCSICYQ